MKNAVCTYVTLIGLLLSSASLFGAVLSGPVYNPANTHSYFLLSDNTWTGAEAEAITLGGHLVTINDDPENTWVFTTFGGTLPLWIGLTDQASEGTFIWSSGTPLSFTKWSLGEPNNGIGFGEENYGYIIENNAPFGLLSGFWNDAPNLTAGFPIYGVVEVPEPGSLVITLVGLVGCVRALRTQRGHKGVSS